MNSLPLTTPFLSLSAWLSFSRYIRRLAAEISHKLSVPGRAQTRDKKADSYFRVCWSAADVKGFVGRSRTRILPCLDKMSRSQVKFKISFLKDKFKKLLCCSPDRKEAQSSSRYLMHICYPNVNKVSFVWEKKNIFCNFMNHLTCLMNKCLFIQYNTVLGYVWCKMVDSFPPSWCGCDQINSSFWCLIVTSFFWHTDTAASDSRQDNPVLQH